MQLSEARAYGQNAKTGIDDRGSRCGAIQTVSSPMNDRSQNLQAAHGLHPGGFDHASLPGRTPLQQINHLNHFGTAQS
jgi:hypothetical protein